MIRYSIFLLLLPISLFADNVELEGELVHPILRMEIIKIPTLGKIESIDGIIKIKKNKKYIELKQNDVVNYEDIIELHTGSSLLMSFKDGNKLEIGPIKKDTWIIFKAR